MFGGAHPTIFQRWLAPVLLPLGGEHFEFPEASRLQEAAADLCRRSRWPRSAGSSPTCCTRRTRPSRAPRALRARFAVLHRLLENKYYVDEFYDSSSSAARWLSAARCRGSTRTSSTASSTASRHLTVIVFGHGSNLVDKLHRRRRGQRRRLLGARRLAPLPQDADADSSRTTRWSWRAGSSSSPRFTCVDEAVKRERLEDGHSQPSITLHPADRRARHPLRSSQGEPAKRSATRPPPSPSSTSSSPSTSGSTSIRTAPARTLPVPRNLLLDPVARRAVRLRHRRHLAPAHPPDDVHGHHRRRLVVLGHRSPAEGVLHPAAAPADRHARHLLRARLLPLLRLLGSHARADVLPHRHLGRPAEALRGDQVLPLHAGRDRC